MRGFTSLAVLATIVVGAFAAAVPAPELAPVDVAEAAPSSNASAIAVHVAAAKAGVTTLSASALAAFAPFTQIARAAYCSSSKVTGWACGDACKAVPGVQITLTGGDGSDVQLFFVGYWPSRNAVVVAHQGTDPTQLESVLTDASILQRNLNQAIFPGISTDVWVHGGFADAHEETAAQILAETKRLISSKGATSVFLVGHSLGGALAELDALMMVLNLPSAIHVRAVTYGTPRVGNGSYATFFGQKVPDFQRVNNEHDLIPILPGRGLGFSHPPGEVHILSPGNAVSCPGIDDADDAQCTIKTVPTIFQGNILDHLGPYEGISIGTIFCS